MDRREFFRRTISKASKAVVKEVDAHIEARAQAWIRPPFAIHEIEFLLACTRCNECITACPHNTIFPLPARLGATVVGTPALDLLNKACHLCEDWPCIEVCEPKALKREAGQTVKLARAVINTEICLPYKGPECGACEYVCPVPGALVFDMTRPVINDELCTGCALCREACIVDPIDDVGAINIKTIPPQNLPNPKSKA